MKLFYFNPHDYGEQAFVVAETREEAMEKLRKAAKGADMVHTVETMIKEVLADKKRGKYGAHTYTLDEVPGDVAFSEIS
jgi:glutamine synthetase type III